MATPASHPVARSLKSDPLASVVGCRPGWRDKAHWAWARERREIRTPRAPSAPELARKPRRGSKGVVALARGWVVLGAHAVPFLVKDWPSKFWNQSPRADAVIVQPLRTHMASAYMRGVALMIVQICKRCATIRSSAPGPRRARRGRPLRHNSRGRASGWLQCAAAPSSFTGTNENLSAFRRSDRCRLRLPQLGRFEMLEKVCR